MRAHRPDERPRIGVGLRPRSLGHGRAAKLTGQLLAFARGQALKPEVFAVGQQLHGLVDMLDTAAGSRISIVTETSDTPISYGRTRASSTRPVRWRDDGDA